MHETAEAGLNQDIAQRLRGLLATMDLVDVARRTAYPVSTVHHYLHGRRIPAAFCAACVRALGVNAAWLLLGRGNASIEQGRRGLAHNVATFLSAADGAVSLAHRRMHELSHPLRPDRVATLRAMRAEEQQLQDTAHTHTKPVVQAMLDYTNGLFFAKELEPIPSLLHTMETLLKLCPDRELWAEVQDTRSSYLYLTRDREADLACVANLYQSHMTQGGAIDDLGMKYALSYIHTLYATGRTRQASRLAQVWLALCLPPTTISKEWRTHFLQSLCIARTCYAFDLRENFRRLMHSQAEMTDDLRGDYENLRYLALGLRGTLALPQLLGAMTRGARSKTEMDRQFASANRLQFALLGGRELLAREYERARTTIVPSSQRSRFLLLAATCIRLAGQGQATRGIARFERRAAHFNTDEVPAFVPDTVRVAMWLAARKYDQAARAMSIAQAQCNHAAMNSLDAIFWLLFHCTNATHFRAAGCTAHDEWLGAVETLERAFIEHGYRCVRTLRRATIAAGEHVATGLSPDCQHP